jgi:hypothetical protein
MNLRLTKALDAESGSLEIKSGDLDNLDPKEEAEGIYQALYAALPVETWDELVAMFRGSEYYHTRKLTLPTPYVSIHDLDEVETEELEKVRAYYPL